MKEKREWDLWEKQIESNANMQGFTVIRIPEIVRNFYSGNPVKVKSSVDFVMAIESKAVFFDAKVTNERVWNLKKYCFSQNKIHQYGQLLRANNDGNFSGYMIWFVDYKKFAWVPISLIEQCRQLGVASISPETVGIRVQQDDRIIDFRHLIEGKS